MTVFPRSPLARWACRAACVLSVVSSTLFTPPNNAVAQEPKKPNVLLFISDDHGPRDAGCYGSDFYETPAIDQLARDGVKFDQAYAAHPRCVPSRMALLSGKFPARLGAPGGREGLSANETTLGEALKEGGYRTFYAGKWHLGAGDDAPGNQGFDKTFAAGEAGATGSHFFPYNRSMGRSDGETSAIPDLDTGKEGEYLADRLTDETIGFLQDHAKNHGDQPFFAVLSHYAVHTPLEGKPELKEHFQKVLAGQQEPTGEPYLERDGTTKMRQDNPTYAAMVKSADESLGRVRTTLKELGLDENTVVIFTSDHGGLSNRGTQNRRELATSNEPLRAGKGHGYEGGIRVPLIVAGPGVTKPGSSTPWLTVNTDFYPTLLEMAGIPPKPQQHLDGVSFSAALRGENQPSRAPIFWHSPRPRPNNTGDTAFTVVRRGDDKFIMRYGGEQDELYNLADDPSETKNLAGEQKEKAAELRALAEKWLAEVKAPAVKTDQGGKKKKKNKGTDVWDAPAETSQTEKS